MAKRKSRRYKNAALLKALGAHCAKLRIQNGYSQERMYLEGDRLSVSAIRRLERGETDVQVSLLYRYAEVLDIPLKKLLDF
jgi:transcriptional regulator with XRE-family HTH domain